LATKQELIEKLVKQGNGVIYICGATKMGADVQTLLKQTLGLDYYK